MRAGREYDVLLLSTAPSRLCGACREIETATKHFLGRARDAGLLRPDGFLSWRGKHAAKSTETEENQRRWDRDVLVAAVDGSKDQALISELGLKTLPSLILLTPENVQCQGDKCRVVKERLKDATGHEAFQKVYSSRDQSSLMRFLLDETFPGLTLGRRSLSPAEVLYPSFVEKHRQLILISLQVGVLLVLLSLEWLQALLIRFKVIMAAGAAVFFTLSTSGLVWSIQHGMNWSLNPDLGDGQNAAAQGGGAVGKELARFLSALYLPSPIISLIRTVYRVVFELPFSKLALNPKRIMNQSRSQYMQEGVYMSALSHSACLLLALSLALTQRSLHFLPPAFAGKFRGLLRILSYALLAAALLALYNVYAAFGIKHGYIRPSFFPDPTAFARGSVRHDRQFADIVA